MISFSNWSTLSWIFSDARRAASSSTAFLSASANAFLFASETLSPLSIVGVVAPMLSAWESWSLVASALLLSSSSSLAASVAEISPFSIAFKIASLPIAALASSLVLANITFLNAFQFYTENILRSGYIPIISLLRSSFLV